ncbi:gamma-glutamyltransferase [Cupriavidus nantongensis]|uniref:Glutathione hydrolase proenzyme n=1 Tax=Cupriavidus nantongensis TaxID=1796606 RepID=A0A142JR12_9BURK|nr:gamma-glutamyltransferase [Cupriavidus nantongensis]AMR80524.1 gamma-glutamyltransferase [Cupriavidus nantongensis]
MREFEVPGRSVALGSQGMVATSNPQAALAGLDVLRSGGNAIDAAIAIAAMLAVVEPTQTGIGGDCFVLLKKPGQPPVALNGAGWAPKAIRVEALRDVGMSAIPAESVHAVTVPGSIRAWERLLADYGTRSFASLLLPAIAAAESGYNVTERLARDWGRQTAKMSATPEAKAVFLADGSAPRVGDRRSNPRLGKALRAIAAEGADAFYEGWIAEDIVAALRSRGSAMSLDDFADYQPEYVTPISAEYRGYQLWECPPSGQGIVALQIASMLNQFPLHELDPLSAERFHLQAEVSRVAYAQRDAMLCDPAFHPVDIDRLLSAQHIAGLLAQINPDRRIGDLLPADMPEHKDTVFISVVDADGTLVAFINSLFDDFGSGLVAPGSGVLLHNRGCGFVLEPGHPNVIAGRKRPMHTIIPALLTKDDEAVLSFGCTGGHFQPAGQLQVLSNILDYGMSVQQAIEHPRMFARGDSLELEQTVPPSVWEGLRRRGHRPTRTANPLGTCHAIWTDRQRGVLMGGSDGRRDGLAIGY